MASACWLISHAREPVPSTSGRLFSVPYFATVYAVGPSFPERWRFGTLIPLILVGYSVVAGILFNWAIGLDSRSPRVRPGDAEPGSS